MKANPNLSSPSRIVKPQFVTLSNGATVEVPEGADPASFKRFAEAKLRLAANPKRKASRSTTRKPSKRSQYARMQSVLGMATLELVSRVNEPEHDPIFVNGICWDMAVEL